jgi:hypothetical protein
MTVIAKLGVQSVRAFGTGRLIELNCVCENDLMAAYATAHEDRLFTKYSPWGEAKIGGEFHFGGKQEHQYYAIIMRSEEEPAFKGAELVVASRCVSITDFGGESRQIEVASRYSQPAKGGRYPQSFNWRMSIDNPPASAQFEPGKDDYWVALYPAATFSMDAALADAHS